jgi:hypothetical protein
VRESERLDKSEVAYGPGIARRKCALCTMFEAPHGCTLVRGWIDPQAVCDRFVRRRKRERDWWKTVR